MKQSPCKTCQRVKCPAACENKQCQSWRRWYLRRWADIHGFYEKFTKEGTRHELETGSH